MNILFVNHMLDPVSGCGTAERTFQLGRGCANTQKSALKKKDFPPERMFIGQKLLRTTPNGSASTSAEAVAPRLKSGLTFLHSLGRFLTLEGENCTVLTLDRSLMPAGVASLGRVRAVPFLKWCFFIRRIAPGEICRMVTAADLSSLSFWPLDHAQCLGLQRRPRADSAQEAK